MTAKILVVFEIWFFDVLKNVKKSCFEKRQKILAVMFESKTRNSWDNFLTFLTLKIRN